ncbi:MAG: aminotransferase class IV [Janthinobacterium lividum]
METHTKAAVWLDGRLQPASDARISPADRGFTLADGLFETIRIRAGQPAHLARHLLRLRAAATRLGIPMPTPDDVLAEALAATCAANGVAEGSARLTLTRGPAPRGLALPEHSAPTLLVSASAGAAPTHALHAAIAQGTRRNEFSPMSAVKSLNYGDSLLARQEAVARGADEAVLLNTAGRLAECAVANLVALCRGRLVTPLVSDGALPGIMRALLVERCGVAEAPLAPGDPLDALFATSSLGVRAVATLDGVALPVRDDLLAVLRAAGLRDDGREAGAGGLAPP